MMKGFVALFLVLCLLSVPVFAQEVEDNSTVTDNIDDDQGTNVEVNEEEVGSLPGDFGYGFQRFFENVDKFFTWDKAEKAKKHAKYGKLRAVEAHIMTKKAQQLAAQGDLAGANETLQTVQGLMEEQGEESEAAQEELEAAIEEGSATEEDVEEVESKLRNSIVVLQGVYEKVPEPAKDGILRALNNSISNQERHEERLQERAGKENRDEAEDSEDEVEAEEGDRGNETREQRARGAEEDDEEIEVEEEELEDEVEEIETEDDRGRGNQTRGADEED